MRRQNINFLFICLLLIPVSAQIAVAQNAQTAAVQDAVVQHEDRQPSTDVPYTNSVSAARSAYVKNNVPRPPAGVPILPERTLRKHGPVLPPHLTYPGRNYGGMWQGSYNGHHAAIGALIGFGIGAAIGAKGNQDQHAPARIGAPIIVGLVGAMIGAAVGAGHP